MILMTGLVGTIAGSYNPIYRSHMIYTVAVIYPVYGGFNGYFSARLYHFFNGTDIAKLTCLQSFIFPTFMFIALLSIDLLEMMEAGYTFTFPGVTAALSMLFLFVANVPFVLFGSWLGRDPVKMAVSVKPNRMKRELPKSYPWFIGYKLNMIFASIVPTVVVYYEI